MIMMMWLETIAHVAAIILLGLFSGLILGMVYYEKGKRSR